MRERERRGHGERPGCAARAGLGWAGLGRVAGQNHTAHTTTNRNPIPNRNPKRDEANTRLNTTSDKRNMLQHDTTPMTT
jgi:ribosomal protein L15